MEVAGGTLSRTDPGMHISRMGGGKGGRLRWKRKRMEQTYAADDDK